LRDAQQRRDLFDRTATLTQPLESLSLLDWRQVDANSVLGDSVNQVLSLVTGTTLGDRHPRVRGTVELEGCQTAMAANQHVRLVGLGVVANDERLELPARADARRETLELLAFEVVARVEPLTNEDLVDRY
jgi:hypothetical protein